MKKERFESELKRGGTNIMNYKTMKRQQYKNKVVIRKWFSTIESNSSLANIQNVFNLKK